MKMLYVGDLRAGKTSFERFKVMNQLCEEVESINFFPRKQSYFERIITKFIKIIFNQYLDVFEINKSIIDFCKEHDFDIVWIDKGLSVSQNTLKKVRLTRNFKGIIVHFNPDDPFGRHKEGWGTFIRAATYYDLHFVSRKENLKEFKEIGCKNVFYYDRSFSTELHFPMDLTAEEKAYYNVEIGFIGSYEEDREESIAYLIRKGLKVRVYGEGWKNKKYWALIKDNHRPAQYGLNYSKAINGMGIALHFLRKGNRDEQDSRTFEIPACGTFMLAERSEKHLELFKEDSEAVFFTSNEELLKKATFYLSNGVKRDEIAKAGRDKVVESKWDHLNRMNYLINYCCNELNSQDK